MKTIQTFRSAYEMAKAFKVILPKPRFWWLLQDPMIGQINGIHTIRGIAVATNGPLLAIVKEDQTLDFGHTDWFVEDRQIAATKRREERKAKDILIAEYV